MLDLKSLKVKNLEDLNILKNIEKEFFDISDYIENEYENCRVEYEIKNKNKKEEDKRITVDKRLENIQELLKYDSKTNLSNFTNTINNSNKLVTIAMITEIYNNFAHCIEDIENSKYFTKCTEEKQNKLIEDKSKCYAAKDKSMINLEKECIRTKNIFYGSSIDEKNRDFAVYSIPGYGQVSWHGVGKLLEDFPKADFIQCTSSNSRILLGKDIDFKKDSNSDFEFKKKKYTYEGIKKAKNVEDLQNCGGLTYDIDLKSRMKELGQATKQDIEEFKMLIKNEKDRGDDELV